VGLYKKSVFLKGNSFLYLPVILGFLLSAADLASQNIQKPSRQSSLEAFSKGDFELAYSQFSELLETYPGDPIYKYYSGVCLVKMNWDPEKAVALLKQALQNSSAVRSLPSDAQFWLARAQQMSGKFDEAIGSYNYFTEVNGRKAARELGVPEFIQECEKKEGRLPERESETVAVKTVQKPPDRKEEEETKIPLTDSVSPDYDKLLSEALELQYKADSVYRIAEEQKRGLDKGNYAERTRLKAKITETQNLASSFQKQADMKYAEAQAIMNKKPFTEGLVARPSAKDSSATQNIFPDTTITLLKTEERKDTVIAVPDTIKQISATKPSDIKPVKDTVPKLDIRADDAIVTVQLFSVFEVKEKAPDEKIEINPKIPPGLVYRVQVAVFRNPVAYSYFKGIVPVYGFKVAGKDLTVYYAGMFRKLAEANKALATIRKKGFKDAFVAALYGDKAVSSEKAAVLEKEWGKKPIFSVAARQVSADTVPPTLTFRIEVIRSLKPVKDDVLESINKLAGIRGLEIVTLADKTMVYLIGTFITFESAEEYTDLLKRNGYSDAKVSAWLGGKEIPVETARELFERLE
jgi:tetratricopeptide (TPR) repeat protein